MWSLKGAEKLTTWSITLLQKLTVAQLLYEFLALYEDSLPCSQDGVRKTQFIIIDLLTDNLNGTSRIRKCSSWHAIMSAHKKNVAMMWIMLSSRTGLIRNKITVPYIPERNGFK
jgi:hypothetical protein